MGRALSCGMCAFASGRMQSIRASLHGVQCIVSFNAGVLRYRSRWNDLAGYAISAPPITGLRDGDTDEGHFDLRNMSQSMVLVWSDIPKFDGKVIEQVST
jgi:hypothetical protein